MTHQKNRLIERFFLTPDVLFFMYNMILTIFYDKKSKDVLCLFFYSPHEKSLYMDSAEADGGEGNITVVLPVSRKEFINLLK